MAPEDKPTLTETVAATIARAESSARSPDGTILPSPVAADTDERALIEALPRLFAADVGEDLALGRTLGEGGMGIVRLADQRGIGRQVAVKCLRPETSESRFALQLLREAWVTGSLEHPNIVPIYSVGLDGDGQPMIVMKRIEGTPWSELIADGDTDLVAHLKIFAQVCTAVGFAASRGVIHRDLKPANVMIGAFGEVYVVDWGIAVSLADDHGGRLQRAKDIRGLSGTPGYMAPEMVSESGEGLCLQTDVYLLGAVLHTVITGAPRYEGDLQSVLQATLESPPYRYAATVPVELAAIANRATHVDPAKRYPSATELREAIEIYESHEGSRQLALEGQARLAAWDALDAEPGPNDLIEVQRLSGEARFAFLQAQKRWPENLDAKRGLLATLERKFDHDFARDDLEAAAITLDELGERRPELRERLQALRARVAQRREAIDALRRLESGRDLDVGRRTRSFLMAVVAVAFSAIPAGAVLLRSQGFDASYGYFHLMSVIKLVVALGLIRWARESLGKTDVNRQITMAVLLMIVMEIGVRPFAERLGNTVDQSLFVDFGIYATIIATLAITVDRRLALGPFFYFGASALSYAWPDNVLWYLAAAHLCFGAFTAFVWRADPIFSRPQDDVAGAGSKRG